MRGVKSLIQKSAPGKLAVGGKFACFRALSVSTNRPVGPKLRGITKLLTKRVYSSVRPPSVGGWRGGAWQGQGGGLRRGKAIDAQVSRLAKASVAARKSSKMLKLTRLAFSAFAYHGLVPVDAQRVVIDASRGIGTAVDVICTRGKHELVLVELKTGFGGDRTKSAGTCMQKPLTKAKDSNVNRHFAQLAVAIHLFKREESTLAKLKSKGIDLVSGCVLYVDGDTSEKFDLPSWWEKRGERIVTRISK